MLIKKHLTKPPNQTPNKFDFNRQWHQIMSHNTRWYETKGHT